MAYEQYRTARQQPLLSKYNRWRLIAKDLKLSQTAKLRLEWIIYHETKAQRNASLVCRHFGIGRTTFYKWFKLFNETNLKSLETRSRKPLTTKKRQATPSKDSRLIKLRKQYPYFGKMKLKVLYEQQYHESITSWYIQRVIETYKLYPKCRKRQYTQRKSSITKKKITTFKAQPLTGFMLHLDSIVLHRNKFKRYIITGVDDYSKLAYARMYKSHSSGPAQDFLNRLHYLLGNTIKHVHTDNGSEFHKYFEYAVKELNLTHWWSRPRTPKDNPSNERFNRTLKEEFLSWGNFTSDITVFNQRLTDWLVEYNNLRPHQTLNYLTPLAFAQKAMHLSTMWSSSTKY